MGERSTFETGTRIPKLSPPGLFEKAWLTAKSFLFLASEKDKERLGL